LPALPFRKTQTGATFPATGGFTPQIGIRCRRRNGFSDKIFSSGYRGFPELSSKMERMVHITWSKSD
jgi:hypothetical protein